MPNDIYTNPPEWNAEGIEPTQTKKDAGWQPGERPPAPWLNWWMNRTFQSLREIAQAFVGHRDATSGVHGIPEGEDIATEGYVDDEIEPVAQGLSEHVADKNNPHGVTAEQIGAAPLDAAIPVGGIIMWSGSIDSIPAGWALCDGRNGTPDLRDRFIVGAGGEYDVGVKGGAKDVTLTVDQIPSHSHNASTNSAGEHTHTGVTNSSGQHNHTYTGRTSASGTIGPVGGSGHPNFGTLTTSSNGAHTHTLTINPSGAHSHTVTVGNTGGGQAHENRPPFFALAYIMRL